jgi:transcriptional regulator with XRE-family HTH domain
LRVLVWEARQRAGLTLQQLEQRTGISRSTLDRIENGQIVPRLDQLEAIAAATGTRITALFDSPFK